MLSTLKEVPIWDEVEQLLDDPYAIALEPNVAGNYQYWPSYRSTQARRRSFVYRDGSGQPCAPGSAGCAEVPLAGHLVHPLNYNHMTGEELRLLNIDYLGGAWEVVGADEFHLIEAANTDPARGPLGVPVYGYGTVAIEVSPGEDRIEEDEASPDFNSPVKPDTEACIVSAEALPGGVPEGAIVCGGDPGEPGYFGFGVLGPTTGLPRLRRNRQYSTPALPLTGPPGLHVPQRDVTLSGGEFGPPLGQGTKRLFDPARGFIDRRNR